MNDSVIVELTEADGGGFKGRLRIRAIRAGLSGNGNFYPDTVLQQAVPLFEGVRVFVKGDEEHLAGRGKDVRNLIGRLVEAAFVPGDGPDAGEIQATLELMEPDGDIARKIKGAWDRGMTGLFGFSIDAAARSARARIGGKPARAVSRFTTVGSVDLIVQPGAGGQIVNLIEGEGSGIMDYLREDDVKRIVGETNLPTAAKAKLIKEFSSPSQATETELREAVAREADYIAGFSDSGTVRGLGDEFQHDRARIRLIEGQDEKAAKMLDAFFDPEDRAVTSIRECYRELTGDSNFTGLIRNCDPQRLRESLRSDSFADVLGDSMARRLVSEYGNESVYDVYRNLADIVPVSDFRVQERTRFGGYGDLPTVAESDPYTALASPTDEKASYAVSKKGGTEDVTLEMITNDDVGAVQRIPRKLVRAAKRTLSKFVLDFVRANPVIYDGLAFFHATHGNLGTAALSGAAVAAGRLAIKAQTELNTGEKLGIGPRFLWVPDELEETAVDLFRRNTENDKTFVQSLSLNVMPVWYWTDTNDWALTADPMEVPTVEVGFLNGNEEPELLVQDSPTSGSMFSHDVITYKIRHIYGGNVVDYRGAYKSVVP